MSYKMGGFEMLQNNRVRVGRLLLDLDAGGTCRLVLVQFA